MEAEHSRKDDYRIVKQSRYEHRCPVNEDRSGDWKPNMRKSFINFTRRCGWATAFVSRHLLSIVRT